MINYEVIKTFYILQTTFNILKVWSYALVTWWQLEKN